LPQIERDFEQKKEPTNHYHQIAETRQPFTVLFPPVLNEADHLTQL
jgi:hypothetical protein